MATFRRGHTIVICGFMITDLNLSGNELLTYAIIFGCTQGLQGCNKDGISEYVASALSITEYKAVEIIEGFVNAGLLNYSKTTRNGETIEEYYINTERYA